MGIIGKLIIEGCVQPVPMVVRLVLNRDNVYHVCNLITSTVIIAYNVPLIVCNVTMDRLARVVLQGF